MIKVSRVKITLREPWTAVMYAKKLSTAENGHYLHVSAQQEETQNRDYYTRTVVSTPVTALRGQLLA